MRLYRVALRNVKLVSVNPEKRRLTVVYGGKVVENMLSLNDPLAGADIDIIFPARYRRWGTRPSELLLSRVRVKPQKFWEMAAAKISTDRPSGALVDFSWPLPRLLRDSVTLGDVKLALKKKLGELSGRDFIVIASPIQDLFGATSLYVAKSFSMSKGTIKSWVRGDLSKIRSVVYAVAKRHGYMVSDAVEGAFEASYILRKRIGDLMHEIHLSLPLFAKGEAYKVYATINNTRTYPLAPVPIMVYGNEYVVMYARIPHTKGYLDGIRRKMEEAISTFTEQAERYALMQRPLMASELDALLGELPDELASRLAKYGLTGFGEKPVTWADFLRAVEAEVTETEYGLLVASLYEVLDRNRSSVVQKLIA